MSLLNRTYTFTDGTTAYGSQVESEIANIVTTLNNLDAATTSWDIVKVVNANTVPLIVDNSSGSSDVADFKVNGVTKVYVGSTGVLNATATIAMNSTKITGLAASSAAGDAVRYEQVLTGQIVGTTTGDNASAGNIGEYISSTAALQTGAASGNYGDLTSIVLTAGDWDLDVQIDYESNGATWTQAYIGVSSTSGNSGTGLVEGDNFHGSQFASSSTTPLQLSLTISAYRVSLSGGATYYLKQRSVSGSGTPKAAGRISARRRR